MIKERIISGMIGALLMAVFQPFGLSHLGEKRWIVITAMCLMLLIGCLVSEFLVRYVCRMPNKQKAAPTYIAKRNICFQIVNTILQTTTISVFLHFFATDEAIDNRLSPKNVGIVFVTVVCVHLILGLYWKNVYWKRHYAHQLEEAQRLNGILQERARLERSKQAEDPRPEGNTQPPATPILLEGATKESLSLTPDRFIYAESEGNYVSVYHLVKTRDNEERMEKTVIRTSIKSAASALCVTPAILQCHRAFLINLRYVESVEGRSSGIGLRLRFAPDIIPVSKSYVKEVKERIQNP